MMICKEENWDFDQKIEKKEGSVDLEPRLRIYI